MIKQSDGLKKRRRKSTTAHIPPEQELGWMKLIGKRGKNLKSGGKLRTRGLYRKQRRRWRRRWGEEVRKKLKKGRENTEVGGKEEMADGIPRRRICDLWRWRKESGVRETGEGGEINWRTLCLLLPFFYFFTFYILFIYYIIILINAHKGMLGSVGARHDMLGSRDPCGAMRVRASGRTRPVRIQSASDAELFSAKIVASVWNGPKAKAQE